MVEGVVCESGSHAIEWEILEKSFVLTWKVWHKEGAMCGMLETRGCRINTW